MLIHNDEYEEPGDPSHQYTNINSTLITLQSGNPAIKQSSNREEEVKNQIFYDNKLK